MTETTNPILLAMQLARQEHWANETNARNIGDHTTADSEFAVACGITEAISLYLDYIS